MRPNTQPCAESLESASFTCTSPRLSARPLNAKGAASLMVQDGRWAPLGGRQAGGRAAFAIDGEMRRD